MKKITFTYYIFALAGYAQTKGITYQAVILNQQQIKQEVWGKTSH
jgi:hypothetical protein